MKILGIYDNGGETLDRFTFVLDDRHGKLYTMLGTDSTGRGFSQMSEGDYKPKGKNAHLGELIDWKKVPDDLKAHVLVRLGPTTVKGRPAWSHGSEFCPVVRDEVRLDKKSNCAHCGAEIHEG